MDFFHTVLQVLVVLRGRQVQFECLIIDVKNLAVLAELQKHCLDGAGPKTVVLLDMNVTQIEM